LFVQRQLPIVLWWHVRWDAVLRAGRGLERVEHRCGPSPARDMRARKAGDRVDASRCRR
jgi:hypothetical protein